MTSAHVTFQRALQKYIQDLPEKKKKRKFIVACCSPTTTVTPESVNESLKQIEQQYSDQPGRRIATKVLRPVVDALKDFNDIISNLASADPMPSALIWGAVKIVVDGAHRFISLFDTIKKELRLLTAQIQRINDYEYLYGDSQTLQRLFCRAFTNIIRFWCRVDKECDTCWYTGMLKAMSSFSTAKLNAIIQDIEEDADEIQKAASILEATKSKAEREAAELERLRAEMERVDARKERKASAARREEAESDRQGERYRNTINWLCSRQGNEDDMRHLRTLQGLQFGATCEWLLQDPAYAPAAAGKSILSSRIIRAIKEDPAAPAIAYHFFRFDQPNLAAETLRILASQLLDEHWNRARTISEDIYSKTQNVVCSLERVQELVTMLVKLLPKSYFILDGLDEECTSAQTVRWTEAATTLDFLVKLTNDHPERIRLWCSSQYHPNINQKLKSYMVFDIRQKVKQDVTMYLSRANPELDELEISDEDKDNVFTRLASRAECNFLWASQMLKSIKETTSLSDMKQFVESGLPDTLDEYYRRIFERYDKKHLPVVSKIFALVAFARRPLRMVEVQEATGLLLSPNPRSPEPGKMPFSPLLRKLLPPLIELQQDNGSSENEDIICRIFHSTLREFLLKNPGVLEIGSDPRTDLLITQDVIAKATLLYLSQTRYARLLRKGTDGRWIDGSGSSVHHFLSYSAKYWDKGMDALTPSEELYNHVGSFLTSPNFQTCIQVQSLWVDGQFGVFRFDCQKDDHVYLRRMLPAWFVSGTPAGLKLWRDFREFVHEWKYFLTCPRFNNPTSETLPYTGELNRCWWPVLGSQNFLSKVKCRYPTFRFENESYPITGSPQCFEGIGADGRELVTLILTSRGNGSLVFTCEQWCCSPGEHLPKLQKTQTVVVDDNSTNWRLYVKHLADETPNMRAGRAPPAAFAQSNEFLRIGTQLFHRNDEGDYIAMPGFSAASPEHPACVEEFAVRGSITVLASRRIIANEPYRSGLPNEKMDSLGVALFRMEGRSRREYGMVLDDESSDESDVGEEEAGYETWSECSSEYSALDDDVITPWAGPLSDMEESGDSDSETDADEGDTDPTELDSDTEVDPDNVVGYGDWHDDDKDNEWGDSDSDDNQTEPRRELRASITILDTSTNAVPVKIFHFARFSRFLLYESPPIIHPSTSLVVWPLSEGDVLFADFAAKTYFVRKLRPSTSYTRQIFVKGQFSSCGLYVHFASLEGQKKPLPHRKQKPGTVQPIKLALLVSTYRLSERKTTRSPPVLVHRARIDLGSRTSLAVSKLPYTLTWTPTHLYFTRSTAILKVFRISLFKPQDSGQEPVVVPRKPIFMPESAEQRHIYYFPAVGNSKFASVILGSETKGSAMDVSDVPVDDQYHYSKDLKFRALYALKKVFGRRSPPFGCYLREETDLGGWAKCHERSQLPDDLGIGQLDRRLEKFDPEDDCDLEPYVH
ncbi:hypothetical protein FB45DRAFT_949292 [Roridomyces roridus]|uniref:NACHT domain-containing protein n=1 Tax=Roridomyces roridus TaxID=1738132 RepID=A0AAD7FA87_9AGAR|nr:hypothetical protein FB45DRAFT_949292 [Roridomyces roridus]